MKLSSSRAPSTSAKRSQSARLRDAAGVGAAGRLSLIVVSIYQVRLRKTNRVACSATATTLKKYTTSRESTRPLLRSR